MKVTADSRISIVKKQNEDTYLALKIGNFPRQGSPVKDRNGADVYKVPDGVSVLAVDPVTGDSGYYKVSHLTVENDCHTVEVSFGSRSVIVSDNESLACFDPEEGRLKKVSPTDIGKALVPVLKKDPSPFGTYGNTEVGWMIGAFLSDGWISSTYIGYAKVEQKKRDRFVSVLRRLHPNFCVNEYTGYRDARTGKLGDSVKLHIGSKSLVNWFSQFGLYDEHVTEGRAALRKRINPVLIRRGSEDFLWGILSGLIDGDGSIVKNMATGKPRFSFRLSTSSKSLRDTVGMLCYRLGIRYSVTVTPPRNRSSEAYTILFSAVDMFRNLDKLSCIGDHECAVLAEFAACADIKDDRDIVPVSEQEYAAVKDTLRSCKEGKGAYAALSRKKAVRTCSRKALYAAADKIKKESVSLYNRIMAVNTMWLEVTSIKDAGYRQVFDLEVADAKVFTVNNGITIWDTVNIHAPVSSTAVKEAFDKMLPERNLISLRDHKVLNKPEKEYLQGLYVATRLGDAKGEVKVFDTLTDAQKAYKAGDIDIDTPVVIKQRK